ncbi:hypothetical protein NY08_4728 [Rhodococcus sp. B7740]|nr:hypothetical protein NY08_4728 [Rhodococcus sp. B7740]
MRLVRITRSHRHQTGSGRVHDRRLGHPIRERCLDCVARVDIADISDIVRRFAAGTVDTSPLFPTARRGSSPGWCVRSTERV